MFFLRENPSDVGWTFLPSVRLLTVDLLSGISPSQVQTLSMFGLRLRFDPVNDRRVRESRRQSSWLFTLVTVELSITILLIYSVMYILWSVTVSYLRVIHSTILFPLYVPSFPRGFLQILSKTEFFGNNHCKILLGQYLEYYTFWLDFSRWRRLLMDSP